MEFHRIVAAGVQKPARYYGPEFFPEGYVPPRPGDVRVALAYPDLYEIGMSNTGLRILYAILRRTPGVYVDLAFCPWPDMEAWLRESKTPLTSRHGSIPLGDFHVLGFSLQYELTYSNILTMLDLARIPLESVQRTGTDPIILAGGPCATHCEPMAPFFDAVFSGEAEEGLSRLVALVGQHLDRSKPPSSKGALRRGELLDALDREPGLDVPGLHPAVADPTTGFLVRRDDRVERQVITDLDHHLPFLSFPVPALETVFDRLSLELARGCQQGCRFCEAGFTYRAPRERSPQHLLTWASDALQATGLEEVSLACLSTADYSAIGEVAEQIGHLARQHSASMAISSLRAYGVDDRVLDLLGEKRSSSLTLAPEAGSQRLRDLINKNVTHQQIIECVERIVDRGWNRLKFYFMLGLPTETEADIEAIADLALEAYSRVRRRFRKKAEMVLAFSPFVPRPHTPFQWESMGSIEGLYGKVRHLRQLIRHPGIKLKWHNTAMSWLEAVLTRGDRSLAPAILRAWQAGARYDSWEEHLDVETWKKAFQESGIQPETFLTSRPHGTVFPWSHMTISVSEAFLIREHERGLAGKTSPPCTPFRAEARVCYHCGAECGATKCQKPEARSQKPEARSRNPEARSRNPEARSQKPEARAPGGGGTTLGQGESASPEPRCQKELPLGAQPTTNDQQPDTYRYWLEYRKVGAATLLGHLDLLRHLILLFRRAKLPLDYSKGFHPRAKLFFPQPLALGMFGVAEWMEVVLTKPVDDSVLEALNRASFEGLVFQQVREVQDPKEKISRAMQADYQIALSDKSCSVEEFLGQTEAQEWPHLVSPFQPSPDPLGWWPTSTDPTRVLTFRWGLGQAPRPDRTLVNAIPGLDVLWTARTQLLWPAG